ncbi:MAG: tetratricopeptide repeat protein [Candidatus Dasytiphilus stammeri]
MIKYFIYSIFILIITLLLVIGLNQYTINKMSQIYKENLFFKKMPRLLRLKDINVFGHNTKITKFSTLVSLLLAKKFINKNEFNKASMELQVPNKNFSDSILKNIFYLRLSRIQLYQGKIDKALITLNLINHNLSWSGLKLDLQGNAMIEKGDINQAVCLWKKSMKKAPLLMKYLLQIKIKYFTD